MDADGRLFAYALSDAGSDWQVWRVRDVATGQDLADTLRSSKFGGASWRKDGSGFYYTAYDPPQEGVALKAADELIYTRPDNPGWFVNGEVTDDGRYLVIQASLGSDIRNTVLVQELSKPHAPVISVIANPTAMYDVIDSVGSTLLVRTDDAAPRNRIIGIDLVNPAPSHWRTLIADGPDTVEKTTLAGGQLLVHRLHDAHSTVQRYTPDGKFIGDLDLPGIGSVTGLDGRADDRQVYYGYSGFGTEPGCPCSSPPARGPGSTGRIQPSCTATEAPRPGRRRDRPGRRDGYAALPAIHRGQGQGVGLRIGRPRRGIPRVVPDPHGQPILLRVETRAGHGQGMPTAKLIDEVVDMYAFTEGGP